MSRTYEIFERFSDGSTLYRASVTGIRSARHRMKELSTKNNNEYYAMNLHTGEVKGGLQATSPTVVQKLGGRLDADGVGRS